MAIRKQLRTTVLWLLLIAVCVVGGLYVQGRKQPALPTTVETDPVTQGVAEATARYASGGKTALAKLQTQADASLAQKAELALVGLGDESFTRTLLGSLTQSGVSATFYVTGEEAAARAASLLLISEAGFPIGVRAQEGVYGSDDMAAKRAITEFVRAGVSIQTVTGVWPTAALVTAAPSDALLAAAYAAYLPTVAQPSQTLTLTDVAVADKVPALVDALPRQTLLGITIRDGSASANVGLGALCSALAATDLGARARTMATQPETPRDPLTRIYTTERAVAFTFAGLGNEAELTGVLAALDSTGGKGTFFVTREEMDSQAAAIKRILSRGHALGIAVNTARFADASAILEELLKAQETLLTAFAYSDVLPVRPAYGTATEPLKLACASGGFTLLSAMVNAVRTEDIRQTAAEPIVAALLPEAQGKMQRGAIIHFQMGHYQRSNDLLGQLVRLIASERNIYAIKPVMALAGNQSLTYAYPLTQEQILPAVWGKIYPGQLSGSPITAISTRYIGIDWVASGSFLPGFTNSEIKRLDKTGILPNKNNYVFLTFDDWGTDQTITELLDVLRAHNAKATFFVRTQNVVYNPNLLRAIAAEGHTLGSHTHTHLPLANDEGNGRKFSELTEPQMAQLKEDLVTSYGVLESIAGDLKQGNKPSVSRLFRPPTLAVSKNGLAAVLDCGFTYAVSGSYTTQDYKTSSAAKLAGELQKNTKSGAVLIMHMSDTSIYTAAALDMYLSEMERKYADHPYRFVSLSEVLE